jgi:hypothetical protein
MPCLHKLCVVPSHVDRLHASCLWCTARKARTNAKYKYDVVFGQWLPRKFDARTAILVNGAGYIIYTDDERRFKAVKEALLNAVFTYAESTNYAKFAKRLFLICEFLAT